MPTRKLVLLIVALLIGLGTIMLARSMMTGTAAPATADSNAPVNPATEVLVGARDLPAGTILKEADLKWQSWPSEDGAANYAVKGKTNISDYVGAVVRYGMRAGEPITSNRVVREHEEGFMAAVLNPGMRAIAIPVTAVSGVAGFVFPGDHVDVIVTHIVPYKLDGNNNNDHKVAETVLTDVRVLALDQKTDDQATDPKVAQTATLEVTPQQAEALVLAAQIGNLSLTLRSIATAPAADNTTAATPPSHHDNVTWDSDVSKVLSRPGNRDGRLQHIQVMRGKDSTESVYELH